MSTYTDLHNRVKENLTVDYHSRVTPQVISALNQENEFWGRFRGSFSGDLQLSAISASHIIDSDFTGGAILSSVLCRPSLFLSVDEESGESVVQDLTAYIAESGIRPEDLAALSVDVVSAEPGDGYSAKYVVTQGGVPAGSPIEIPRAGVVKDAHVRTCEEDDKPIAGLKVGDKYLDIEFEGEAGKHVYVSLKDLTDVYTGGETETVSVGVSQDNVIRAAVADGSVSRKLLSADVVGEIDGISSAVSSVSAWLDGRFDLSEGVLSAKDDALAVNALSVSFGRVCDLDDVPLSGLLRDLCDRDTVFDVCVRVNDIISLAGLGVAPLDFWTCSCEDLFAAVRQIADDESIVSFGDAVEGLNSALRRLGMANRSLESRLSFLMRRIDDVIALADKLGADVSRDIAAGDAAVLAEVRLSADEFLKAAKSAEERIDGRITKAIARASAAEGVLSKRIAQIELSAVTAPELAAESAARIAADRAISATLTAEVQARDAAVGALGSKIEILSAGLSGCYQKAETSSAVELAGKFAGLSTYSEIRSQLSSDGYLTVSSFSPAQVSAMDSGITSALVSRYNGHIADADIHVLSDDKTNWNGKYAKPVGGIPKSDLDLSVRASLSLADTAVQSLSDYYQRTETSSDTQLCSEFGKYMLSADVESRLAGKWSKDDDIFSDHGIASKNWIGVLAAPAAKAFAAKAFAAAPEPEYAVQVVSSGIIVKQEHSIGFPLKSGTMVLDSDFAGKVALSTISEVEDALGLGDLAKKDSVGAADLDLGLSASISSRAFDVSAALSVQFLSSEIYGGFVKYADVRGGKDAVTADNPIVTLSDLSGGIGALSAVTYADLSAKTIDISSLSASCVSACFSHVVDADEHSLSDYLKELPSGVTVFGVCVRTNDVIRFAGRKDVSELPYDTAEIEDTFDTVRRLTGADVNDFESVRVALNASLSAGLGPDARTLSGQIGILMGRDDGIVAKVDALSAEAAKATALAEASAFLSGEIGKKADSAELTAYALSANVMSRETAAGRFDGVNGRIDGVLAKLKGVYNALSGLPANPAEFNLIENVAPALIALRSALSVFA